MDICSAPTGVERRRTAAMWKMSLKRPAAGGESSKAGFFLVILPQQKKMCKILRDFAVLPAVAFQTGLQ
nr:hypothetical protein [uncultured Anaerostipes sp.]